MQLRHFKFKNDHSNALKIVNTILSFFSLSAYDWQEVSCFYMRCHDTQHNDTWNNDTQHNDTQHNDTQHSDSQQSDIQHYDTQHIDTEHNDTQHNYTQHNDNQHKHTQHYNENATLSKAIFSIITIETCMLSVANKPIIQCVILLNVVAPYTILYCKTFTVVIIIASF